MPSSLLRRACALVLPAVLVAAVSAAIAHPARTAPLEQVDSAALVGSSKVQCLGDAVRPPASRVVAYASLPGGSFAKRAAAAGDDALRLSRGSLVLHGLKDDAGRYEGALLTSGGLIGAGIRATTVRLAAHSSTRKSLVPTAAGSTNPLYVLRLADDATVLRGLTLRGTAQGHLYNGIMVEGVHDLRADHVRVQRIPGSDHAPPGETFAINDYRTVGSRWNHVRVDGMGIGASGFGVNSSKSIRICDSVAKNNTTGMGFAFWQSSGITCVDCRADDNGFAGFNFERTSGAVTLVRPEAHGNKYDMRIASDQKSAKFVIKDPKLRNGVWTIWMPRKWYTTNRQKQSDVSLYIHGKKRNDLLRFRMY